MLLIHSTHPGFLPLLQDRIRNQHPDGSRRCRPFFFQTSVDNGTSSPGVNLLTHLSVQPDKSSNTYKRIIGPLMLLLDSCRIETPSDCLCVSISLHLFSLSLSLGAFPSFYKRAFLPRQLVMASAQCVCNLSAPGSLYWRCASECYEVTQQQRPKNKHWSFQMTNSAITLTLPGLCIFMQQRTGQKRWLSIYSLFARVWLHAVWLTATADRKPHYATASMASSLCESISAWKYWGLSKKTWKCNIC